jgi:hypothetical protein
MSNKKVIGVGGAARSGKDTFASILSRNLQQAGKSVKRIALADPLKENVDAFLLKNLGVSAFTSVPEEKLLIRPMLVWYGDAQRKRTNGRYWIDLAKKTIDETNYDYYIITDVRYDVYEKDELYFLKNEVNGVLCHISKYTISKETRVLEPYGSIITTIEKRFVQPANEHEEENDPKIKAAAHHAIEWEHVEYELPEALLFDPQLNAHVDKFMDIWIQKF